jgi:hypothetical protein
MSTSTMHRISLKLIFSFGIKYKKACTPLKSDVQEIKQTLGESNELYVKSLSGAIIGDLPICERTTDSNFLHTFSRGWN